MGPWVRQGSGGGFARVAAAPGILAQAPADLELTDWPAFLIGKLETAKAEQLAGEMTSVALALDGPEIEPVRLAACLVPRAGLRLRLAAGHAA